MLNLVIVCFFIKRNDIFLFLKNPPIDSSYFTENYARKRNNVIVPVLQI